MGHYAILLATALAPIAIVFTIVFMMDRYDREPLKLLIWSFVFGILIAVPVVFAEIGLKRLLNLSEDGSSIFDTAILAFLVVALSEEGFKFLILRFYAYRKPQFNEPYDGIMYAVAVSMGFAAIENVLYVAGGGVIVAVLRALTAVPAHGAFAHMMGYYAGKAKFKETKGQRAMFLALGLGLAVLAHGAYDFFLMINRSYFAFVSLAVLVITIIMAVRAIRAHRRNSPFRSQKAA